MKKMNFKLEVNDGRYTIKIAINKKIIEIEDAPNAFEAYDHLLRVKKFFGCDPKYYDMQILIDNALDLLDSAIILGW